VALACVTLHILRYSFHPVPSPGRAAKPTKNAASQPRPVGYVVLPFWRLLQGQGGSARSQQMRLGQVAKIKVKAEARGLING
jgi:hypothetical protein